jgi:hypothetical protein
MSAVSTPIPITRASSRTIACGSLSGARSSRSARVFSIELICSRTNASRAMSRRNSSIVFVGKPVPSGIRRPARRSGALRKCALNPRIPRRASALFMRLMMRERSLTRLSRSRFGRLASSSSIVGIATIPQCPRSPRNQPRNTRINIAASRRSVFARLRSRDTATLAEWMTCVSIPRATSQRASQKPSRPAS